MLEQFVVFTSGGQVVYQFNCLGKKFAETQINRFISHLLSSPTIHNEDSSRKYRIVEIAGNSNTSGGNKAQSRGFCSMYHVSRRPELYYVVTYAEQSLQLNQEAEETLQVGINLWESLGLSEGVLDNINGKGSRNERNCIDVLTDLEEELEKFDQYLKIKYEEILSRDNENSSSSIGKVDSKKKPREAKGKKQQQQQQGGGRKWGRDGTMEEINAQDSKALDFSENNQQAGGSMGQIDKDSFGKRTNQGDFLIKEIDDLLSAQKESYQSNEDKGTSAFGFLRKHLLGNKTITETDLKSVLDKLKQKLITKNVAPEAAEFLCKQVSLDLVGSKTASWTSVENTARESLTKSLTQILTPGVSVDLLHEIQQKAETRDAQGLKQPYVFSVVGVNGVGKSTNLSKLAFWLLQNNLRVLVVASDTFRSGAVEQLRVHVENLAELTDESHIRGSKNRRDKTGNDHVELFEAGYGGSDLVTKIAKQAIKYAKEQEFDIVLMDTAGRRHNDPTLMSPLKSFAEQAKPDKIIMVGEALVGTDSVQQAKNFNEAFGRVRNLDFFIISKCDTVGEMLGTMVNMVYATGIPILFVGVGQTYTDLRVLSVNWAVNILVS
ncbi:hypothetical protein ZYGR_0AD04590 [Zygosaccharomyces rouxii]|uniref:Signal recognition particle receptor subunit alpha homolog n=2 Tax=Zygosaccharomyces rouxii TaxID=4956 RepID=C5E0Z1_ZYGRC|nr:uncharacterized protein ZYRO0G16720g [Zygosaccharomyces rouxii]KAH9202768.1 SRX-domain-containing protein [Zygosaccharomyces rouxii]GAV51276.1 hypothetical protein ZYGR_0AD04590 [Zygosaccharomyces rouxii]CAR29775.1 ZYRO0G16720p [Zygosaccharomyces rouxii]